MGITNCCSSKTINNDINQITFNSENLIRDRNDYYNLKGNKIVENINNNKNDVEKIKKNFEDIVKFHGDFITDRTIEQILEETNPLSIKISLPEKIEKYLEPNCFISPPIKFNNGEIYKGSWNLNNQRHGFGIGISPEGNIFKGLWKEDKVGDYGLFLDAEGNYYKGELKEGKSDGNGEMVVKDKYKYIGTFLNDFPNGRGQLENYENNTTYEGEIL